MQADLPITNGGATINGQRLTGMLEMLSSENEGKSRYYAMSLNYQKTRGSDEAYENAQRHRQLLVTVVGDYP
jgi:hypothetical protein